jgi:UTP--glucose-1-phosphate uridylyltransferase
VVSGPLVAQRQRLYSIEQVVEKPTPTLAEQQLVTPGLRAGHYLGFFGMHVLTSEVLTLIEELLRDTRASKPTLSDAVARLPSRGKYLAYQLDGSRYNLGIKYGLLKTQLAIGLAGRDRDQILAELIDLMASRREAEPVGVLPGVTGSGVTGSGA